MSDVISTHLQLRLVAVDNLRVNISLGVPNDTWLRSIETNVEIAGDLLAKEENGYRERERLIGTGYIALSRRFNNGEYRDMHLVIDNTLTTISKSMLGLNLSCARCHDHKFDPLSQKEFYQLAAYFNNVPDRGRYFKYGNTPPVVHAPTKVQQAKLDALTQGE